VDPLRNCALDEDAPSLRSHKVCKLWCDVPARGVRALMVRGLLARGAVL
jgi:hypothetical protein